MAHDQLVSPEEVVVNENGRTSFRVPANVRLANGMAIPSFDTPAPFKRVNEPGGLRPVESAEEAFIAGQRGAMALKSLLSD